MDKKVETIKHTQAQKYYCTGRLATPKMLEMLAHRLSRKGFQVSVAGKPIKSQQRKAMTNIRELLAQADALLARLSYMSDSFDIITKQSAALREQQAQLDTERNRSAIRSANCILNDDSPCKKLEAEIGRAHV